VAKIIKLFQPAKFYTINYFANFVENTLSYEASFVLYSSVGGNVSSS